jgi:glycine/D-amino acid oxidase-like deaminating enzyme
MAICILGAGIAGLATAIKLKEADPDRSVIVVEKPSPESNSQISGQRYRVRVSGQLEDPRAGLTKLLASRNGGIVTEPMERFSELAQQETAFWIGRGMPSQDEPPWFGPQFGIAPRHGAGRGKWVLTFLRNMAAERGVRFHSAEVRELIMNGGRVEKVFARQEGASYQYIAAESFVLAGGSLGGRLFHSSNKKIRHTPQELAYLAGIPLVDSTMHLIHAFGNCTQDGVPKTGAFETDQLSGAEVYFADGEIDGETTQLLRDHQAHYQMHEISRRFVERGGRIRLDFPDGRQIPARVSYHYCHLAVSTLDGVRVSGVENLFAVGDASGVGYWTNHKTRFPGFAMTKCLVDAEICRQLLDGSSVGTAPTAFEPAGVRAESPRSDRELEAAETLIRDINTRHLFDYVYGTAGTSKEQVAASWFADLSRLGPRAARTLWAISLGIANAHQRHAVQGEACEPFTLSRSTIEELTRACPPASNQTAVAY